MRIVDLGHYGRDVAIADRLEGHELHFIGKAQNAGLVERAEQSGGAFHPVKSITDVELIADIVQGIEPDMFFTHFDDSLAGNEEYGGVVDAIQRRVADKRMPRLLIPSPNRAASRVEWDKFMLREILEEIYVETGIDYNPDHDRVTKEQGVRDAINRFRALGLQVAVKPRNLAGGKGVKVMGKNLETYDDAEKYALEVVNSSRHTGAEIQRRQDDEELQGLEFTLQIHTDGTNSVSDVPVTHDYPYREDGDTGPGTGGMGTHTMKDGLQPFVTEADKTEAIELMERILLKLKERGIDYKGILYPTFFKTTEGLKMVEINARGGDPELINVVDLMEEDVDYAEVLKLIALGELATDSIRYRKLASTMLYLVSPDYSYRDGDPLEFDLDTAVFAEHDVKIRFAAAKKINGNNFIQDGNSRSVGFSALDDTPWGARARIHTAIRGGFKGRLVYRNNIGDESYINNLRRAA